MHLVLALVVRGKLEVVIDNWVRGAGVCRPLGIVAHILVEDETANFTVIKILALSLILNERVPQVSHHGVLDARACQVLNLLASLHISDTATYRPYALPSQSLRSDVTIYSRLGSSCRL